MKLERESRQLFSSLFYVPGHVDKYFNSVQRFGADALILDLEDSVPAEQKAAARKNVAFHLSNGTLKDECLIVRINELDTRQLFADLKACLHRDVLAIMPSKIRTVNELLFIDEVLAQFESEMELPIGHFGLLPLIETLDALINLESIAKCSKRLLALAFGGEDYLKELGGAHGEGDHTFDYPRTKIVIAARSAGLQAIDTPYLDVDDIDGFSSREQKSKDLGYEGCLLIHPKQIELANSVFSPDEAEVDSARRLFEAVQESERQGLSVALIDGVLIGPPMMKQAAKILSKMELINAKEAQ